LHPETLEAVLPFVSEFGRYKTVFRIDTAIFIT